MNNRRSIVFSILILVCISLSLSTFKNYEGKNIEEIKEKTNKNDKLVFRIQQDNGGYTEQTSGTFPNGEYLINTEKTKCVDKEDKPTSPTITYQNGTVTVTGKNTVYCEIYFDKCIIPETIRNSYSKMDFSNVSKCEVGGMYRYQGTDSVKNWICFGTTDQNTCTSNVDKYMYRIIGVTPDGELKLIKETFVKVNDNTNFKWNDDNINCGTNGEKCLWPDSMIFKRLNGNSLFIGNSYYGYLNSGSVWLDKIENYNWKYGVLDSYSYDGNAVYAKENAFTSNTQAKVGLIYIHDYLYAYKTNESDAGNPGNSTNAANSWIHYLKDGYNDDYCNDYPDNCNNSYIPRFDYENTMVNSKFNNHPWYYYYLGYSGSIFNTETSAIGDFYGNRPVFYLTKDTTIKSGAGEKNNPYILDVVDDTPAPTCHFEIITSGSASGVKLVHENASSWYVSQSQTNNPKYGMEESYPSVTVGSYYGYVMNNSGKTGTCTIEIVNPQTYSCSVTDTKNQSGKCSVTTYSDTRHQCIQTGSSTSGGDQTCTMNVYDCNGTFKQSYPCASPNQSFNYCSGGAGEGKGTCTCTTSPVITTYQCENGSSCTTSGCCSSYMCGSSSYSCSNGRIYSSESQCTSQNCNNTIYTCSDGKTYVEESDCTSQTCSSCASGYTASGKYCYRNL